MITRSRLLIFLITAFVAGISAWLLLRGPGDPRELVLGDWKEHSGQMRVEVTPDAATARGMIRGELSYEWLDSRHEPYRLLLRYKKTSYEALIHFPDKNTAVVEPLIWSRLSEEEQKVISDLNRRHNRPAQELRFLFHRMQSPR